MNKKRYAIVRVDMRCPYGLEETFCSNDCHRCRLGYGYYGDTKEQLIRKVAQMVFKTKIERYKRVWKCDCSEMEKRDRYKDSLALAKEIVKFLGVEE